MRIGSVQTNSKVRFKDFDKFKEAKKIYEEKQKEIEIKKFREITNLTGLIKMTENRLPAEKPKLQEQKVFGYINPLWGVKVVSKEKTLIELPLFFLIHTYLKDYGFDPDQYVCPEYKTDEIPEIILTLGDDKNSWVKFPLFFKNEQDLDNAKTA